MSGDAVGFLVLATALVAVVALFVVLSRLRSDDLVAALRSGRVPVGLNWAYRRRTSRLHELLLQVDDRLPDPREA